MSQGDQSIANQAGAAFRADVNTELQALVSQSSGASAPGTTYPYQRWADTTTGIVKRRNAANSAWVADGPLAETYAVARSSNTILAGSDHGKFFRATASFTQTLTAAATLGDGWWVGYRVDSGASLVLDPNASEQVDSATTKTIVGPSAGTIFCDGSGFYTYGFGVATVAAANLGSSALGSSFNLINGTIVTSRAGSAETIAIKTSAGADPSATDPVYVVFRNATAGTGDYTVLTLTAATSITISSGSTLGMTNSVAARIWLVGFNDAGTFRLGVINRSSASGGIALSDDLLLSSTAEGGAGGADTGNVIYTGSAVTSKALRVLAYLDYTLATVGTWNTAPSKIQLAGPNTQESAAFISADQTITSTGTLTIAHGLGVIPVDVEIWLRCSTGEHNYTAGDVLMANRTTSTSGADNYGVSLVVDATNLNIRFGSATGCFVVTNKTTGAGADITNGNWKVFFKARAGR